MVRIVRKRPFVSFVVVVLLIAAGVIGFGLVAEALHEGNGTVLRLIVRNDPGGTFSRTVPDVGDLTQNGQFSVQGDIFAADDVNETNRLGTFRCWGWNGGRLGNRVCQEYELDGWGKVEVQGSENPRPQDLAIVGGTGHFAGARGVLELGVPDRSGPGGFPRFTATMQFLDELDDDEDD